uniref:Uncharacterized protein n=1 Tax=Plectus sambesii TaxID=2011161 RepID=A0A914UQB4_9BILA
MTAFSEELMPSVEEFRILKTELAAGNPKKRVFTQQPGSLIFFRTTLDEAKADTDTKLKIAEANEGGKKQRQLREEKK